jgi:hypothetical protein
MLQKFYNFTIGTNVFLWSIYIYIYERVRWPGIYNLQRWYDDITQMIAIACVQFGVGKWGNLNFVLIKRHEYTHVLLSAYDEEILPVIRRADISRQMQINEYVSPCYGDERHEWNATHCVIFDISCSSKLNWNCRDQVCTAVTWLAAEPGQQQTLPEVKCLKSDPRSSI